MHAFMASIITSSITETQIKQKVRSPSAPLSSNPEMFVAVHTLLLAAAANDKCASVTIVSNAAILSLGGDGNLLTKDVATAVDCQQECCQVNDRSSGSQNCTAWTFTSSVREECPKYGCCFLKDASAEQIKGRFVNDTGYSTGCIEFSCPPVQPLPSPPSPSPPPPSPAVNFTYAYPSFNVTRSFAFAPEAHLRDPTTAVFDPVSSTWSVASCFFSSEYPPSGLLR
jgi:hypothetical protein